MNASSLLLALGPWLGAVVLMLLLIAELARMLVGRRHPLRIMDHALTCGFYLLLTGILVPLGGVVAVIWWGLGTLTIAGVVLALVRSRIAQSDGIARSDLPRRGSAEAAGARRTRRRVLRASRPSTLEIAVTAVLFVAAVVLALAAG